MVKLTQRLGIIVSAVFLVASAAVAYAQAVPPTPSGVTATLSATGQVSITWTGVTDDAGIGGYNIYRNGAYITTTAGTSITDSPGVGSYSYTVAAYDNSSITSGQSIPSSYITILPDYSAPSAPTGLTATAASGSVALSWTAASDNIGVAGYYLYRNGAKVVTADAITGTSYTDTGAYNGAIYKYTVSAYDAAGNISGQSNAVNISFIYGVPPASAPSSIYASVASQSEIDLHWNPPVNAIGVAGYYIFRGGSQVGTASGTVYADTGLTPSTTYSYTVAAYDAAGTISYNNVAVSATTMPPDTTSPTVPGNLSATGIAGTSVKITWAPSYDNVHVAGYTVFRDGTQIGTVTTSTFYADSGLATSTTYTYSVSSYDAAGNASAQASFFVKTLAADPAATAAAATPTPTMAPPPPPPVVAPGTTSSDITPGATTASGTFSDNLYFGLRTVDVTALQNLLIAKGDLEPQYATGFFGTLTQSAVQKFQCEQNIVCAGDPGTTGWGSVGPKTRAILNAGSSSSGGASGEGAAGSSAGASVGASVTVTPAANATAAATLAQLLAQVQALQAQLAQMQANGQ